VGPDANHKVVLVCPIDGRSQIEVARGPHAHVLADLFSVEPHRCAELGFVDDQTRTLFPVSYAECLLIPEIIAWLQVAPEAVDLRLRRQDVWY
jgi:hypothetical protein